MSGILQYFGGNEKGLRKLRQSYFVATALSSSVQAKLDGNATPTVYTATEALMTIHNSASSTDSSVNNVYVVPDYVRMKCTTTDTGSTDLRILGYLDNINRYSSGGTVLTHSSTSLNSISGYTSRTPKCTIYAGDVTATAVGTTSNYMFTRTLSEVAAQPSVELGDDFTISFGTAQEGSFLYSDAIETQVTVHVPLIWIGPGCTLTLHPLSTAADTLFRWEIEVGYLELGHPTTFA